MARWNTANVLQSNAGGRHLWNLAANGEGFTVQADSTLLLKEPSPPLVVGKDWQTLFRKKLNVAWLPADKVYFRVVQLPAAAALEVASVVGVESEKMVP